MEVLNTSIRAAQQASNKMDLCPHQDPGNLESSKRKATVARKDPQWRIRLLTRSFGVAKTPSSVCSTYWEEKTISGESSVWQKCPSKAKEKLRHSRITLTEGAGSPRSALWMLRESCRTEDTLVAWPHLESWRHESGQRRGSPESSWYCAAALHVLYMI